MVMKIKLTAILPLYLACMVMLAFAVLPHHHHSEYICFTTLHCEATPEADGHPSHDHGPFAGEEGCVKHLFQTEITRNLSLDHTNSCQGHCHHFSISLFTLADLFSFKADEDAPLPDIAYHEKLHGVLYAATRAGRAPPADSIC